MNRLLIAMVVGLLASSIAVADIPPPPPPKGKKYVSVNNEVVLGKDVTGYVFVKQVTNLPPRGKPAFTKLELTEKKATAIPEPARRTYVTLFVVPQDAAKGFKSDEELFDALGAKKVNGVHRIGFYSTATVSDKVKGDTVKWTHTITGIDPKDGVKVTVTGEGYEPPAKKQPGKERPPVYSSMWMAGLAVFAALMLGGFWLVGRGRKKA